MEHPRASVGSTENNTSDVETFCLRALRESLLGRRASVTCPNFSERHISKLWHVVLGS